MKTKFLPVYWYAETAEHGRPIKYVLVFVETGATAVCPSFKLCKNLFKIHKLSFEVVRPRKTCYEIHIIDTKDFPMAYYLVFGNHI